jgi:hypothetical protein
MELSDTLRSRLKIRNCPSEWVSNPHGSKHILTELFGYVRAILGPCGAFKQSTDSALTLFLQFLHLSGLFLHPGAHGALRMQ